MYFKRHDIDENTKTLSRFFFDLYMHLMALYTRYGAKNINQA